MAVIKVSLPAYLQEFVDAEIAARGPPTPMTKEDWARIRRQGLGRLAKEKKSAAKHTKKQRHAKRSA